MLWFLIVSLFARAAVGVHDDVATSVCEAEWFDARASWTDLDLYCQNWQGPRIYQCLDLFSHSQRLARTFTRHAKQAVAFDIASNQQEDILARSGFYLALDLVLMLCDHALICAGPPCSLFVSISQSVHQRYVWCVLGNLRNFKVRMSNAIATNAATLLKLALRHRPTTFLIIEQPKGSFMFKMDVFRELFLQFSMFLVLTYLGLFGHDLLKASHLQSNMETLASLARRATRPVKKK